MGTVIYSASPLQAFMGAFGPISLLFAIGLIGIGLATFRRGQSRRVRVLTGALGSFLVIVSFGVAAITLQSISSGTRAVALNLDNKRVVEDNCGDNGETCARYVLESTTGTTAYEFDVSQDVYDQAQVNTCYRISYFANKGLFSSDASSFQQIDRIALIETTDPVACQ